MLFVTILPFLFSTSNTIMTCRKQKQEEINITMTNIILTNNIMTDMIMTNISTTTLP